MLIFYRASGTIPCRLDAVTAPAATQTKYKVAGIIFFTCHVSILAQPEDRALSYLSALPKKRVNFYRLPLS